MINIHLRQPELEAGQQLHGSFTWHPSQPKTPKAAIVTVAWRTAGRGYIDKQNVTEIRLEPGFGFEVNGASDFSVLIPSTGPVSYDGGLLQIIWEVHVSVNLSGLLAGTHIGVLMFRVLPRGALR